MAKQDLFKALFGALPREERPAPVVEPVKLTTVDELPDYVSASSYQAPVTYRNHDGEKFAGGFGDTQILATDYWTLRARSAQLFKTNMYARGIIDRLLTNEINTGLHLEATPEEKILGLKDDSLADWTEDVENRFELWSKSPRICDRKGVDSFGSIQLQARRESLIDGDVLVINEQDRRTRLPSIRLQSGDAIQTPFGVEPKPGNRIVEGVEIDGNGRHVAFYITQQDGTSKRLPAWGEKSGRRLAWLVYGGGKRVNEVRGEPLLSRVQQSLREIDRYRDSTQRKALLGSLHVGWIEKGEAKAGSGFGGRSKASGSVVQTDNAGINRSFSTTGQIPGVWHNELQHGESVKFNQATSTDEKFTDFEAGILYGVAWSLEIPPEILTLSFNSNYSASQAAINEFKMYLDRVRVEFGATFCGPIYQDWLLSEVLNERVSAPGFLKAYRDPMQYDKLAAWVSSDWAGHIKPSTDILKQVKGYTMAVESGFITDDRATREVSGMKHSKVIKAYKRAREKKLDAGMIQEEPEIPGATSNNTNGAQALHLLRSLSDSMDGVVEALDERVAN